jgi:hypothetical protein
MIGDPTNTPTKFACFCSSHAAALRWPAQPRAAMSPNPSQIPSTQKTPAMSSDNPAAEFAALRNQLGIWKNTGVMETARTSIPAFAVREDSGCSSRTVIRSLAGMPVTGCNSASGYTASPARDCDKCSLLAAGATFCVPTATKRFGVAVVPFWLLTFR